MAYSHELDQGCYPQLQYLVPGRCVHSDEDELTAEIGRQAAEGRVDRLSAYRQLQGISAMTSQLHHRALDDYAIPHAHVQAVQSLDERRVVVQRDGVNVAFIVNKSTQRMKRVLPDGLVDVPLLVLLLDQSSVGAAGAGYVDHLNKMIVMKWEKIHRLINDIKGPLKRCCQGAALKAYIYASYLWCFHSKPFGSGFFGTVLQRALNVFALRNNITSPTFQKYLPRLSAAWAMPCSTDEEQQLIFDRACDLHSIRCRGEQAKLGRLFSWNAAASKNLSDRSAWKMVLEDYLGGATPIADPDASVIAFDDVAGAAKATPHAALMKLREEGGGLKLAYRMMTDGLQRWCWIIVTVTKALWDWYTEQTTEVKCPHAMLKYNIAMAKNWNCDGQLRHTFQHSLYTARTLKACQLQALGELGEQERKTAKSLLELSWSIVGERVWSLAARHSVPPDSYATYFGGSDVKRQSVFEDVAAHARRTYWLDQKRLSNDDALELWRDCHPLHSTPVRAIWAFFERDGVGSRAAHNLLKGCIQTLADNKGVEELHKYGKNAATKKSNSKKHSPCHLQHALTHSRILENRGIAHDAAVGKASFLENFNGKRKFVYKKTSHYASSHKLPPHWSTIMGRKSWRTTSEISGRVSASAWYWLHAMSLDDPIWLGRLSRWILPMTVFRTECDGNDVFWASLLRGKWAALAWLEIFF